MLCTPVLRGENCYLQSREVSKVIEICMYDRILKKKMMMPYMAGILKIRRLQIKVHNATAMGPSQLGLKNAPTASLRRGKTSPMSVLNRTLNILMLRI